MSKLLWRLLKNVAGLNASLLAGAAAATGEPSVAGLLLALATMLLVTQAWAESHGQEGTAKVEGELRGLIQKHGTLAEAVAKLADGIEILDAIDRVRASDVLTLMKASEAKLDELREEQNALVIYAANFLGQQQHRYGERFEKALQSLERGVNESLARIEEKVGATYDTTLRIESSVEAIHTKLADIRKQVGPETIGEEVEDAARLIRGQHFKEALAVLDQLRNRRWTKLDNVCRYRVLANMGIARQAMDEFEAAADLFIEAKGYRPDHEQARCFEAMAWTFRAEHAKAFQLASDIITDFPASSLGWATWVRSAPEERTFDEIAQAVPAAVCKDAEVAAALSARAYNAGHLDKAELYGRSALEGCPDSPELMSQLGTTILQRLLAPLENSHPSQLSAPAQERARDAVAYLDKGIERLRVRAPAERMAGLLLSRAQGHRLLGEREAEELDIEHAHAIAPRLPWAAVRYAQLLAGRKEIDPAIAALRNARGPEAGVWLDVLLAAFLGKRAAGSDREEAIRLLEAQLPTLRGEDAALRYDCVATLFQVFVDAGREGDAEQLLAKAVPELIPAELAIILRACSAGHRGDMSSAREFFRQAFDRREHIAATEHQALLARHLQQVGMFAEALTIWRELVRPDVFGPHTGDLLHCAQKTGDDQTILDFCQALRKSGFEERQCIELETHTLTKYGEYDAAIRLLQQSISKAVQPHIQQILRLRLSVLGLQLKRIELVEHDRSKLPQPDAIAVRDAPAMVAVLRNGPNPEEAVRFAYAVVRSHFHDPDAHAAMIASLMAPIGPEVTLPSSDTVQLGFGAYFREHDEDDEPRFFILEDGASPDVDRGELAPDHRVARQLMGKRVKDRFVLNPGNIHERQAVIIEVVHKFVARARDSMSGWERRFPDRFFVQHVKLTKTPDGKLDFTPVLKSIDDRVRAVEEVERVYRDNLLPLHVFSCRLGRTVFDALLHVADSRHLRVRCSTGTEEERANAVRSLDQVTSVVIDVTALASVFAMEAVDLITTSPRMIVSQGTLDTIEEVRDELIERSKGGSLGKHGEHYTFTDYTDARVQEQNRIALDRFEALLRTIRTNCQIRTALPLSSLAPKRRQQLIDLFGQPTAESVVLAKDVGGLLWADDFTIGAIAEQYHEVHRIWTYILAQWLAQHDRLQQPRFLDLTLRLVSAGYAFTPVSAELVVHAAKQCKWDPDERLLSAALDEFARPELSPHTLSGVVAGSIVLLWRNQVLEGQASQVVMRLLDRVAARPRGFALLDALEPRLEQIFGLDIVHCMAAQHTFRAWRAGARRIAVL